MKPPPPNRVTSRSVFTVIRERLPEEETGLPLPPEKGVGKQGAALPPARGGCVDNRRRRSYLARPTPCPDGGIGRRTSFRCWRSQGRGGSSPLLGTTPSQHPESIEKSSARRSKRRVCYDPLLRNRAVKPAVTSGKTLRNGSRDCYGNLLRKMLQGVFLRGGQFYLRRSIPLDVQATMGRAEIWRSLRTDSPVRAWRRASAV